MPETFTEGRHAAEFLISEDPYGRSRDNIVIESGAGILKPGTVLGVKTGNGKYVASPVAVTGGAEAANAVLLYSVDATSQDVSVSAITRDAQVNVNLLSYAADVDQPAERTAKAAQLAAVGIVVR